MTVEEALQHVEGGRCGKENGDVYGPVPSKLLRELQVDRLIAAWKDDDKRSFFYLTPRGADRLGLT